MAAKLRPTFDNVIVRPDKAEAKTSGGILLPDAAKKAPKRGVIIWVGPGKVEKESFREQRLAEGDKIYYSRFAGSAIRFNDEDLIVMKEEEVFAVVEE